MKLKNKKSFSARNFKNIGLERKEVQRVIKDYGKEEK